MIFAQNNRSVTPSSGTVSNLSVMTRCSKSLSLSSAEEQIVESPQNDEKSTQFPAHYNNNNLDSLLVGEKVGQSILEHIAGHLCLFDIKNLHSSSSLSSSPNELRKLSPENNKGTTKNHNRGHNTQYIRHGQKSTDDDDDEARQPELIRIIDPCESSSSDDSDDSEEDMILSSEPLELRYNEVNDEKSEVQRNIRNIIYENQISLRSISTIAHSMALEANQKYKLMGQVDPETFIEPQHDAIVIFRPTKKSSANNNEKDNIPKIILLSIFHNIPLSILLDVSDAIFETSLHSTVALFQVSSNSINGILATLANAAYITFDHIQKLNPFFAHDKNLSQSVGSSTGVLSISQSRISAASSANIFSVDFKRKRVVCDDQMLRRLNRWNSTAKVLHYMEKDDDVLTEQDKKRVQKMMHYQVPLRPFVATVSKKTSSSKGHHKKLSHQDDPKLLSHHHSDKSRRYSTRSGHGQFPSNNTSLRSLLQSNAEHLERKSNKSNGSSVSQYNSSYNDGSSSVLPPSASSSSGTGSPFMCTPKSFPPTPSSRSMVMARGTRFAEDVLFLARDQLRVEGSLISNNARTRAMAKALKEGSRLAVFNANDSDSGIHLSCGQHVATKVSNELYCSIRSMIPLLHNCYVYYEMTVLSPQQQHSTVASLSIGLSTLSMPLDTLVGGWKSSVGLCTNGQIFISGAWCSPLEPLFCTYGNGSTIGCLVKLDDEQIFQTWDGQMVTASITFNVDGHIVELSPLSGSGQGIGSNSKHAAQENASDQGSRSKKSEYIPTDQLRPKNNRNHFALEHSLGLLIPRQLEVYPTLTLHSSLTQVMGRFSSEDILALNRSSIGAPNGVTVYALDGSVIFDETVDTIFRHNSSNAGGGSGEEQNQQFRNTDDYWSETSDSLEDLVFDDM